MKGLEEYKFTEILYRVVLTFPVSMKGGKGKGDKRLIVKPLTAILNADEETGFLKRL